MASASSPSLDQLEHETERNRAVLVETVDTLRETILGEVEDMRRKVSVGYLKSELGDYARSTGTAWYDTVQRNVRENPLRSFAIGAGLMVPLWKVGRSIPMPLVLIGAGAALAHPAARSALGDATAGARTGLGKAGDRSSDVAQGALENLKGAGAQAGQQVASGLDAARQSIRSATDGVVSRVSDAIGAGSETVTGLANRGSDLLRGGADQVASARGAAGRSASQAQSTAMDLFHQNPLLVAGAGVAIGALIAAVIPATQVEGRLLDSVAPDLKRKATDLIDEGYEAASGAADDLYGSTVNRAKDQGLSPDGARDAVSTLGDKLSAVAEAALGQAHGDHPASAADDTNHQS